VPVADRIRAFLELGRTHGALLTAYCGVVGLLASPNVVDPGGADLHLLVKMTIIGIFIHFYGCAINELRDIELDAKVAEISHKPLVSGRVSEKEGQFFCAFALFMAAFLFAIWFPVVEANLVFLVALFFGGAYSIWGKYTPWAYEFTLGTFGFFFVLAGALAVGEVNLLVWIVAGEVFLAMNYSIYDAGIKDADTDRTDNVPTRAVIWGYKHGDAIDVKHPLFKFAVLLKVAVLGLYAIPIITTYMAPHLLEMPVEFIVAFFVMIIPSQVFVLYRLLGTHTRLSLTRYVVLDLALSWLMAPLLFIDILGLIGWIVFFATPILWAIMFNFIMYRTYLTPKM